MADFSDLIVQIGDYGFFQKKLLVLCSLPSIPFTFVLMGVLFLGNTPNHWCAIPEAERLQEECGWTEAEVREVTIPRLEVSLSHCDRFDLNLSQNTCGDLEQLLSSDGNSVMPCDGGWAFDRSHSTIVSEFSLVCERSWLADLNQFTMACGLFIGAFITGYMSDRFGRKPCFIGFMICLGIAGVGIVLSPWYPLLLAFRFLQGFFEKGACASCYVLLFEFFSSEKRKFVSVVCQSFISIGMLILPGLAYLVPSWRTLQLIMILPSFLFIPYYWIVPESPRWLFSQKRNSEAMRIVSDVAKCNGRRLPQNYQEVFCEVSKQKKKQHPVSFLDLFRTPFIRRITLILIYAWQVSLNNLVVGPDSFPDSTICFVCRFSSSIVFYGLILSLGMTGDNHFLDFFMSSVVEIPAGLIFYLLVDRIGRRSLLAGTNLIGGLACLAVPFISPELSWLKKAVAFIGRLAIATTLMTLNFANTELYPTTLRNLGTCVCSSACDAGVIVAPLLLYRLATFWQELPFCLYGVMSVVTCGLVTLLPEMKGVALPETIEDMETLRRKQNQSKEENVSMT
ncbi:organic cation transporter 2 [Syngnathus acus]|uniref:organic cation transporter 2 n=1 Tax=Syngnathus acus TaxID=161584 RepID=UPI001885D373|nr:organic cation transporter 2 [Syngnathus acus]